MPAVPLLVMVAGPNGSGKTTLIRALQAAGELHLPDLYINADELQRSRGIDAAAAQKLAETLRLDAIVNQRSVMYETVMSHPSKIAELQAAVTAGYAITILFVATDNPQVNIERIALRVADGGHDVPKDRVRARHRRSIALAPAALAFAAHAYIYDNTAWGGTGPQELQAVLMGPTLQPAVERPARWVADLIEKCNGRTVELGALDLASLTVPNLYASVAEGPITSVGDYYVLQDDHLSGKTLLHDKTLLVKPVTLRHSYRIEYAQGVGHVIRRPTTRIRAIKATRK
ncbi:MAG: zeta toxin family protein [Sulfurifustaceae bacterium]